MLSANSIPGIQSVSTPNANGNGDTCLLLTPETGRTPSNNFHIFLRYVTSHVKTYTNGYPLKRLKPFGIRYNPF